MPSICRPPSGHTPPLRLCIGNEIESLQPTRRKPILDYCLNGPRSYTKPGCGPAPQVELDPQETLVPSMGVQLRPALLRCAVDQRRFDRDRRLTRPRRGPRPGSWRSRWRVVDHRQRRHRRGTRSPSAGSAYPAICAPSPRSSRAPGSALTQIPSIAYAAMPIIR